MTDDSSPESSKVMSEAAAWVSRLIKEDPEPNYEALKAWYSASEENRTAFADAIFSPPIPAGRRGRVEKTLGKTFPSLHPPAARIIPIESVRTFEPDTGGRANGAARARFRIGTATAACAAMIAIVVVVLPNVDGFSTFSRAHADVYETGHGDIRSFALADGSNVTLDTDSRIRIVIDRELRQAAVEKGRVRFSVKAGPRPFAIEAGMGKVLTRAGSIDIAVDRDRRVNLQLRSGSADLHDRDAGGDQVARMLAVDQQVTFPASQFAPHPVASPLSDTHNWPAGWTDYRTIPLAVLIGEANRYAKLPIILDDAALASLAVTGRFKLTDTEGFIDRIGELFSLSVSRRQDGIHLSRK